MSDATTVSAFERVSSTAYAMLMTNLLVGLPALPVVVLYLTTDPAHTWHALLAAAPLAAPLAVAAFGVMAELSAHGSSTVVRTFLHSLRRGWGRALVVGAQATTAAVILGVDVAVLWGTRWGAVAIPVLVMLALNLVATTVTALVALAEEPRARLVPLWRAALLLSVRRWYLSAMSLVVLGVLVSVVLARPALGLGLLCAPALYVVRTNARIVLRPVLADDTPLGAW